VSNEVNPADFEVVLKPKERARMLEIGGDPEFGPLLAYRPLTRWPVLLMLIVTVPFMVLGVGAFIDQMSKGTPGHPSNQSGGLFVPVILFFVGLLLSALVVVWFLRRNIEFRFYKEGTGRWRRKGDAIQRLAYVDVSSMTYTLTRQFYNGVYVGTAAKIQLETPKGSKIKGLTHSFSHREKRKGMLFNTRFVGRDPMDVVRDVVAETVAERMALEVAELGEAAWTGPGTFTKEGLRVKKLLGAPRVIPYATLDRLAFKDGNLVLFEEGKERGSVALAMNGKNFWPGFALFQRLVSPSGGADEIDAGAIDGAVEDED
jgi:hypothetical protein